MYFSVTTTLLVKCCISQEQAVLVMMTIWFLMLVVCVFYSITFDGHRLKNVSTSRASALVQALHYASPLLIDIGA